jgi:opacity protein-like surface antigen
MSRLKHSRALIAGLALVATTILAADARAFGLSGIGGKLGFLDPEGGDGTVTLGAHLEFERPDSRVHIQPGVLWWSVDQVRDINANLDLSYHFLPEGRTTPYLGAGLGVHQYDFDLEDADLPDSVDDSDTDLGLNLFGGLRMPGEGTRFFAEGRYAVTSRSQFSVLGGVTFHWDR